MSIEDKTKIIFYLLENKHWICINEELYKSVSRAIRNKYGDNNTFYFGLGLEFNEIKIGKTYNQMYDCPNISFENYDRYLKMKAFW